MSLSVFDPVYVSAVRDIKSAINRKGASYSILAADNVSGVKLHDGHPVTMRSSSEIESYFYQSSTDRNYFLPSEGFRIALFSNFNKFQSLIFAVKFSFEMFLLTFNYVDYSASDTDCALEEAALKLDDHFTFSLELETIYKNWFKDIKYDTFNIIINQILFTKAYFHSLFSQEMDLFARYFKKLSRSINTASDSEISAFQYVLFEWEEAIRTNAEKFLEIKDFEVSSQQLMYRAIATYGKDFYKQLQKKQSIHSEISDLEKKIELKKKNPDLSEEKADSALSKLTNQESLVLERVKKIGPQAVNHGMMPSDVKPVIMSPDEVQKLQHKRDSLSRKICLLNPVLHQGELNEKQKEFYDKQFRRMIELKKVKLGINPQFMAAHQTSIYELEYMLNDIKNMYCFSGSNMPVHLIIQGNSLSENIDFIKNRIMLINNEIVKKDMQLSTQKSNSLYRDCVEALSRNFSPDELLEVLTEEIKRLRQQKCRLLMEIRELFITTNKKNQDKK